MKTKEVYNCKGCCWCEPDSCQPIPEKLKAMLKWYSECSGSHHRCISWNRPTRSDEAALADAIKG